MFSSATAATLGGTFSKRNHETFQENKNKNQWFEIKWVVLMAAYLNQPSNISSALALKLDLNPRIFKKPQKWHEKQQKMMVFPTVFWSFWVLDPILAHQTAKFKLSGQFCFSRHPWGPWERQSSGVICIWKIFQLIFWWRRPLAIFFPSNWRLMSPLLFYIIKKCHYHFALPQ